MATIWPYGPRLTLGPYVIRREFRTEIITSRSGREQRRALRQTPRVNIEYTAAIRDDCLRAFDRDMVTAQRTQLVIPDRVRFETLTAGMTAGQQTVAIYPQPSWLTSGSTLMLVAPGQQSLRTVTDITGSEVTFLESDIDAWPSGTRIHPLFYGYLSNAIKAPLVAWRGIVQATIIFDGDPGINDIETLYESQSGNPSLSIDWYQSSWHPSTGGDKAAVGVAFLDSTLTQIDSAVWSSLIVTADHVWTSRSLSTSIPSNTETLRLYMKMVRLLGSNNDGYIDDISMSADSTPITITNPGAELGSTSGWTSTTGTLAVRTGDPLPNSGSYYFYGGTSPTVIAYQDIDITGYNLFASSTIATLSNREVFYLQPNKWEPIDLDRIQEGSAQADYGFGRISRFFPISFSTRVMKLRYTACNYARSETIRALFDRMKGRQGEFFMPTFQPDLVPLTGITSGGFTIEVSGQETDSVFSDSTTFSAIAIRTNSNQWIFRIVSGIITTGSPGDSILTVSEAWDSTLALDQIEKICWLPLWRFASDTLEISWVREDIAQITLSVQMIETLAADI